MAATRPPRSAVRAAVRAALADLVPGDRVLVGLSGGPDSLALLAAAVVVATERGLACGAVIVDHGLQTGSAEVATRAAGQARILGCSEIEVVPVQVATGPGSGGLEAAARAARYAAFQRAATGVGSSRGAATGVVSSQRSSDGSSDDTTSRGPAGHGRLPAVAVLLGHTRDDQAETVLLGLARGSGTRSLAGMSPRAGLYRRPLLELPRALVADAAAEAAREDPRLEPWTDPHNADPTFARVRVRTEVLPGLERALGPGIGEALARTAGLAREDADALDGWADTIWASILAGASSSADPTRIPGAEPAGAIEESGSAWASDGRSGTRLWVVAGEGTGPGPAAGGSGEGRGPATAGTGALAASLDASLLTGGEGRSDPLPAAIRTRLVLRFLLAAGCPTGALTAQHVRGVTALLDAAGTRAEIALPGGLRARREGGALVVRA